MYLCKIFNTSEKVFTLCITREVLRAARFCSLRALKYSRHNAALGHSHMPCWLPLATGRCYIGIFHTLTRAYVMMLIFENCAVEYRTNCRQNGLDTSRWTDASGYYKFSRNAQWDIQNWQPGEHGKLRTGAFWTQLFDYSLRSIRAIPSTHCWSVAMKELCWIVIAGHKQKYWSLQETCKESRQKKARQMRSETGVNWLAFENTWNWATN